MPRKSALLLTACLTLPWLTSCAGTTADSSCAAFSPITVEQADQFTPETARSILAHNRVWRRLCGEA
jgi:hypothetical protein